METTPNDLRQQQFDIKFRGYNPDDVEVFRDLAATALEEARAEVLKLTEENKHLRERLEHLIEIEETLKAAVLEAQKNAESTIDNARDKARNILEAARKEAELVMREARVKYEETLGEMNQKVSKMVSDINKIRFIRSTYLSKLKSLMDAQREMVEDALREEAEDQKAQGSVDKYQKPITRPKTMMPSPPPQPEPEEHQEMPANAENESNIDPEDEKELSLSSEYDEETNDRGETDIEEEPVTDSDDLSDSRPLSIAELQAAAAVKRPPHDAAEEEEWRKLKEQLKDE